MRKSVSNIIPCLVWFSRVLREKGEGGGGGLMQQWGSAGWSEGNGRGP